MSQPNIGALIIGFPFLKTHESKLKNGFVKDFFENFASRMFEFCFDPHHLRVPFEGVYKGYYQEYYV